MNENKKMRIVVIILGLIATFLIALAIVESKNQEKALEKFNQYFESETEKLIYFARKDCSYCIMLSKAKDEVLDKNNIDYYYVDTDKINKQTLDKMLDKLKITKFETPTLAIVKNNEIVNIQSGVFSSSTDNIDELTEYLEQYNIIEAE